MHVARTLAHLGILSVSILASSISCWSNGTRPTQIDSFTIERSPGNGNEIPYRLFFTADGEILFEGGYRALVGLQKAHQTPQLFQQITQFLEDRHFAAFESYYSYGETCRKHSTDQGSYIISAKTEKLYHSVFWYMGCEGFDDEMALRELIRDLEDRLELESFLGTEAEMTEIWEKLQKQEAEQDANHQ